MAKKKRNKNRKDKRRESAARFAGLRRRTEKVAGEMGFEVAVAPGREKMSEVILDFADPLLRHVEDVQGKRACLSLATYVWNIGCLPERERPDLRNEIIQLLLKSGPPLSETEVGMMIDSLVARKDTVFPEIRRMILDFEFVEGEDEFQFNVASVPFDQPE